MADEPTESPSRPRLSASRAFVVHLLDQAEGQPEGLPGRVEHVVSGRSARFDDVAALMAFFRDVLDDERLTTTR